MHKQTTTTIKITITVEKTYEHCEKVHKSKANETTGVSFENKRIITVKKTTKTYEYYESQFSNTYSETKASRESTNSSSGASSSFGSASWICKKWVWSKEKFEYRKVNSKKFIFVEKVLINGFGGSAIVD